MDVTVAHIFAHYMPTLFHARTDTYITSVYNILESLEDFFELHAIRLKEPIQDYFNYLINPLSEEGILKIVVDPDRATRGKIQEVLSGNILFENLYTGYEAKWERESEYNRDIIMGLVMYSYFYKNVLSSQRPFQ